MTSPRTQEEEGQVTSVGDWAAELLDLDDMGRASALEQMRPYLTPSAFDILSCILGLEDARDGVAEENSPRAWAKRLLELENDEDPAELLKVLDSHLNPYDKGVIMCVLDEIDAKDYRETLDAVNALANVAAFGADLGFPLFEAEEDDDK